MAKFLVCSHCKNVVSMIKDKGVPVVCCGEKMNVIEPNTVDASQEKHVPVVKVEGEKIEVMIGSVEHPMIPEHLIEWIYLETEKGGQIKYLSDDNAPKAVFTVIEDKPIAVYAYCNIHGLWKSLV